MGSDAAGEERDGERRRMGETRLRVRLLFSLRAPSAVQRVGREEEEEEEEDGRTKGCEIRKK